MGGQLNTVVGRVFAQAVATPEATAIVSPGATFNYRELAGYAASIAGLLAVNNVKAGDVVGICLPRSAAEVAARLGVMAAGAAFLPLDPEWPAERRAKALAHAGAVLVLVDTLGQTPADAAASGLSVPPLDLAGLRAGAAPARPMPAAPAPADLAYVIFTSGSTGAPKCVELTHANLIHLVDWHLAEFAVTAADRASHVAGLAFDAAVWDVWPHLCAGASVAIPEESCRTSPELLLDWISRAGVSIAYVPTVLAQTLIRAAWPAGTRLRHLLTGGEALRAFPRPGLGFAVTNCYGPTECTVVATAGRVPPAETAPDGVLPTIGRAIAGAALRIVDAQGNRVPPGRPGEIWILGGGVGRGYRGDPALTAERFVLTPDDGVRAYRTGDLAHERPDGEIGFLGRVDRQEKIRGMRIETDEIVLALNEHPAVGWSEVTGIGEGEARRLVAYVLPAGEAAPGSAELRAFLGSRLPEAMVPSAFYRIDALPLTSSGKLDRERLPHPDVAASLDQPTSRAPSTPTEQRLAHIIAGILDVESVGADDNFFLLGGHSLLGTRVVLQARAAFGVDVTLRHLFAAQTVAELALVIEGMVLEKLEALGEADAASLVEG
jgi:amino acid adenylation domain-containing protein